MIKPYFQNDLVTLYKGDCLEIMPELDEKFDCCITDPPYFVVPKGKFGDNFKWDFFQDEATFFYVH